MAFRFERISPDNIEDLIPLYKDVFGKQVPANFLHKKYDTNYLGKAYYGYIAYNKQNYPAGYYGAIPFHVQLEKNSYRCAIR